VAGSVQGVVGKAMGRGKVGMDERLCESRSAFLAWLTRLEISLSRLRAPRWGVIITIGV